MKKILFAAIALIVAMASCVKDEPYTGITISDLSYTPSAVMFIDPVTVTASISSFYTIKEADLIYTLNDADTSCTVVMTMDEDTKLYSGVIPAYPDSTKVAFYVKAISEKMEVVSETKSYKVGETPLDYSVIVLNELNGDQKFIEIYNNGDVNLPLVGMTIKKDEKKIVWTADETVIAPAKGYLVLYSEDVVGEGQAHQGYPESLVFGSGLSGKKTLKIELFEPDGTFRDEYVRGTTGTWGTEITNVKEKSFSRTPDGGEWKLTEATPGAANPAEGEEIPQE